VRALRGGISSAVHALRIDGPSGATTVVLRCYVLEELKLEEPDIARREAHILRLLERCPVRTPALLAVDPSGEAAGVPAVVMSRIPGRIVWAPDNLDDWLHRLAAVLPEIHASPITTADGVREFTPYVPDSWDPPSWLSDQRLWTRALAVFHRPRLDPDRAFIHRDYHPGNVLWLRGRLSGVVDWQAASIGPRAADVAHCRRNLISHFNVDVADRFSRLWESISGETYHPWAEVVTLVDSMNWLDPPSVRECGELEALLARSLAALGA
jgi:aminoglycoside phosphotransferase (APT) family kinase protein